MKKVKQEDVKQENIEEIKNEELIDIAKIEKELQLQTSMPQEDKNIIKKKLVPNILICIILILYYIFIELGFTNIETNNYIIDLKVFSGVFLVISIYLFEKSYKNDSGSTAIYGIEMLILSIFNFVAIYMYYSVSNKFEMGVFAFAIFVAVYYMLKTIILYIKKKKEYFFERSDIKKIVSSKKIKKERGI